MVLGHDRPVATRTILAALLTGVLLLPTTSASAESTASASAPAPAKAPETGSVLGYQCGEGVCVIDPDDPRSAPRQVAAAARFAGVTADGKTIAYVQDGGNLVTAPVAGGAETTVYTGSVGFQPVMSPDGTQFLWQFPVPINGFYYTYRYTVGASEPESISACSCIVTHGWAGKTAIGAFPGSDNDSSEICIMGTTAETGTSSSCGGTLVSDLDSGLGFPDATNDGELYVASANPANNQTGTSSGPIALYSRSTGARVKALTTGATDATPTFSQEGDRVAFDRDGTLLIVDVATGAERVIGPGVYPSWGGVRSDSPTTGGGSGAVTLKGTTLTSSKGKVRVKIACTSSGRCTGKVGVTLRGKALAQGRYAVAAGRTEREAVMLTKRGREALRARKKIKVKVVLTTPSGKVTKKMTLRR